MLDYGVLRVTWWLLMGIVLIGFAVMDGLDLGAGALVRIVARTDLERRGVIATFEPFWEGNQVWFILGGGAVFAAWPYLYAASFSGFYFAILLILLALILRPVALNFRDKSDSARWRAVCDGCLIFAGFVPTTLFGVAIGNLFLGVPLRYDATMRIIYLGGLLDLLRPFALLVGLVSLAMFLMHGASYLALKAESGLALRAEKVVRWCSGSFVTLYIIAGAWLIAFIPGDQISSPISPDGPSNPLLKQVATGGNWVIDGPLGRWACVAATVALVAALATPLMVRRAAHWQALIASGLTITATILSAGLALFPFLMPSSLDRNSSLTVWDASSSLGTLKLMLFVTVILLPIVVAYTTWVFHVMRGRITLAQLRESHGVY